MNIRHRAGKAHTIAHLNRQDSERGVKLRALESKPYTEQPVARLDDQVFSTSFIINGWVLGEVFKRLKHCRNLEHVTGLSQLTVAEDWWLVLHDVFPLVFRGCCKTYFRRKKSANPRTITSRPLGGREGWLRKISHFLIGVSIFNRCGVSIYIRW